MSQNLVSLQLSNEQLALAEQGLAALEQAFAGLVSLTVGERRRLTKMGEKSEVFCRQALRVLAQNPHIVPESLGLAEAQADLVALDQISPLLDRLQRLAERGRDTEMALEELERLRGVDGREGVGAGDDGGDAARRGRGACGAEALLVPLAGLADLDADVDDARREAAAAAVPALARAFEDLDDAAVVDHDAADEDPVALGIDHSGVG